MATSSASTIQAREGNRDKLLRGAAMCLREKGYARTTARDIAASSGANLASIGYHFGSKEALLNEALIAGFREWTTEIERAAFAPESTGASQRLENSLAAMVDRFTELEPLLTAYVEALPQAVRSPELKERMAASYEQARSAGAQMIIRAARDEGLNLQLAEAKTLASLIAAVCDGLMLQWLLDRDRVPTSRELMTALAAGLPALLAPSA